MSAVRVQAMPGAAIGAHVGDIAALRIAVFREWPYLYDGDVDYEASYLSTYMRSPDSVVVGCASRRSCLKISACRRTARWAAGTSAAPC